MLIIVIVGHLIQHNTVLLNRKNLINRVYTVYHWQWKLMIDYRFIRQQASEYDRSSWLYLRLDMFLLLLVVFNTARIFIKKSHHDSILTHTVSIGTQIYNMSNIIESWLNFFIILLYQKFHLIAKLETMIDMLNRKYNDIYSKSNNIKFVQVTRQYVINIFDTYLLTQITYDYCYVRFAV